MIKITRNAGFHITFENGYTVSVQFGPGTYCDNYDKRFDDTEKCGEYGSSNAECAVWKDDGDLIECRGWGNTVKGWMTPDEILKLLKWAARQKKD